MKTKRKFLLLLLLMQFSLSYGQKAYQIDPPDQCVKCSSVPGNLVGILAFNFRDNTDELVFDVRKESSANACNVYPGSLFIEGGNQSGKGAFLYMQGTPDPIATKQYNAGAESIRFEIPGTTIPAGESRSFWVVIKSNTNDVYTTGQLKVKATTGTQNRLKRPTIDVSYRVFDTSNPASATVTLKATVDPVATVHRVEVKERLDPSKQGYWNGECGLNDISPNEGLPLSSFIMNITGEATVDVTIGGLKYGKTYDVAIRSGKTDGVAHHSLFSIPQEGVVVVPPPVVLPSVSTLSPTQGQVFNPKPKDIILKWQASNCNDLKLTFESRNGNSNNWKKIADNVNVTGLTEKKFSGNDVAGNGEYRYWFSGCATTPVVTFCFGPNCPGVTPPSGDDIEELKFVGGSLRLEKELVLAKDEEKHFKVNLTDFTFAVFKTVAVSGNTDVDMFVKRGEKASSTNADVKSESKLLAERVRIDGSGSDGYKIGTTDAIVSFAHTNQTGMYYVMLKGGSSGVTIKLSVRYELLQTPFAGDDWTITQMYNVYSHNESDGTKYAIDFWRGCIGPNVLAAADGYVSRVDYETEEEAKTKKTYGNALVVDHGDGYETLCGHMHAIADFINQAPGTSSSNGIKIINNPVFVKKGQGTGLVGMTGNTGDSNNGIHIHFHLTKYSGSTKKTVIPMPMSNGKKVYNIANTSDYIKVVGVDNPAINTCDPINIVSYPNPTTDGKVTIVIRPGIIESISIVVSDIYGKKHMTIKSTPGNPVKTNRDGSCALDLSSLSSGTYIISVTYGHGGDTDRVIIAK